LRRALCLLVVPLLAACGGSSQVADEPEGTFKVEVVGATFPQRQHIAQSVRLRLKVHNADPQTLHNVAVTVATKANGINSPAAFGQRSMGNELADSERPIWILDEGPVGADTAYDNTWLAGTLLPGQTRELEWKLVATKAGRYSIGYRVSPGLTGTAKAAQGRTSGTFEVTIDDEPVPARVDGNGRVIRGDGNPSDPPPPSSSG
jgi:hypothetical protein